MEPLTTAETEAAVEQAVDLAELEETLEIDGAVEIAGGFLEDIAPVAENLKSALATKNRALLKSTAHMLKGCCKIIFARSTADLASKMEILALEEKWDDASALMPELLISLAATIECLTRYLARAQESS